VIRADVFAITKVAEGGSLVWKAPALRGFSSSPSSPSSSASRRRRRLLDDLLLPRPSGNTNGQQSHHQHRSAGLAALLAGGTVAAAAGAFYVVSSAKEKNKSAEGGEEAEMMMRNAFASSNSSSVSSPSPSSPSPPQTTPCAQPGAAPEAAPVDRAALLADLRAWLEAAGADVVDVDIRPCEGNSAGVGVFATADRGAAAAAAAGGTGPLATAGAVAASLGRRLNPFGSGRGGGGGGTENANDGSLNSTSTSISSASPPSSTETVVLASFPLSLAVTPAAALADESTGSHYARLLASPRRELADERALVMLFLAVERARGRSSRWAQWIAALPRDFSTPLHFTDEQLALLDGTTLGKAAASLRARLSAAWGRLSPAAAEVAAAAGVAAPPTLEDFKWAYSTFWSRGMAVPWPVVVPATASAVEGAGGAGAGGAAAGAGAIPPPPSVAVEVVECILPRLDFCNHAPGAAVRWTLWGAGAGDGKEAAAGARAAAPAAASSSATAVAVPDRVALVAPAGSAPRPGDELLIDYGDKSQEELLLLYGFAHATSAATGGRVPGVLMVPCPLPAAAPPPASSSRIDSGGGGRGGGKSENGNPFAPSPSPSSSSPSSLHPQTLGGWDPDLEDRLELLKRRGLVPQVFLPVSGPGDDDEAPERGKPGGGAASSATGSASRLVKRLLWPFSSSPTPPPSSPQRTPASFLPSGVWDTLEVFVLEPEFVRGALAHPDAVTPPRGGRGSEKERKKTKKTGDGNGEGKETSTFSSSVENAGLRMAVLTTLARLLEGTVLTLEGPGGTGPLEADVAWLEEQKAADANSAASPTAAPTAASAAARESSTSSSSSSSSSSDSAIRRACVEYRATQKAAARRWLARARRAVDEQVGELEGLMAAGEEGRR